MSVKRRRTTKPDLSYQGVKVRNKFELRALKDLSDLVHRGRNKPRITYEEDKIDYTINSTYNPDFKVEFADGSMIYIETKGRFDYDDQRKMRAVKDCHPELDIRIVFERDSPVRKGAKMKYSDWAVKNEFMYAIGGVPKEWLDR